jgi:cytidine deaminase
MISKAPMESQARIPEMESSSGGWDADELIRRADLVRLNASTPLSRFRVGAAALTVSGAIFEGCNTESLIPILSVCAERNAINHSIIHGENDFKAIAVVSDLYAPLLPCGACLQYLQEFSRFAGRDILVIAQGRSGDRVVTSVSELFKGGFSPDTTVKDLQQSLSWTME